MSGTQHFILGVLAVCMPLLTVLMTFILAQQHKIAKAVNGLQDKLMAETRTTGRMEGAHMEAVKQADSTADGHLTIVEAQADTAGKG